MALSRRNSGRFSATIWPGFVDAMTALILVLFFVLSIFMIVQFVLRDTITGQGQKLDELTLQVANLADALGLERSRADRQAELVATVTGERDAAVAEISEYETRVQTLLSRNTELADSLKASEAEKLRSRNSTGSMKGSRAVTVWTRKIQAAAMARPVSSPAVR